MLEPSAYVSVLLPHHTLFIFDDQFIHLKELQKDCLINLSSAGSSPHMGTTAKLKPGAWNSIPDAHVDVGGPSTQGSWAELDWK